MSAYIIGDNRESPIFRFNATEFTAEEINTLAAFNDPTMTAIAAEYGAELRSARTADAAATFTIRLATINKTARYKKIKVTAAAIELLAEMNIPLSGGPARLH